MQSMPLSDEQLRLMDAAEAAIAKGDLHVAAQIGDDLIRSGIPKETVQSFETALAESAGMTSPSVYRDPVATLPSGKKVPPSAWGGVRFHGTNTTPPETAFADGLEGRGPNTDLNDHVHQRGDSAFRGTTEMAFTPDKKGGAGYWAGEGGWVYKIRGTPSWDVNAALEGRVPAPDGTYRGNIVPDENEHAVLANIPPESIEGAWQVIKDANGNLALGPFIKNPNFAGPQ